MAPRFSVIVPVKNGRVTLPATLHALTAQAGMILNVDYEIIVVDDGSDDGTAEVIPNLPGLRVLAQANAGPASARNSGARAARGQILAFTDADCIPAPDWLHEISQPFEDPLVQGVKGAYRTREPGRIPRFVQSEFEQRYRHLARYDQIDFIDTYSAAYRADVFLSAGGFDVSFPVPSVEDQELSFRLASAGARLVFQPSAVVYHRHDLTVSEYARRKFGIGYWKAIMLRGMPGRAFKDTYTPQSLRIQIGLAALFPLCLALSWFWPDWLFAAAACLVAFAISALPFLRLILALDRQLVWWTLPLLAVRAYSLGCGLAAGLVTSLLSKKRTIEKK